MTSCSFTPSSSTSILCVVCNHNDCLQNPILHSHSYDNDELDPLNLEWNSELQEQKKLLQTLCKCLEIQFSSQHSHQGADDRLQADEEDSHFWSKVLSSNPNASSPSTSSSIFTFTSTSTSVLCSGCKNSIEDVQSIYEQIQSLQLELTRLLSGILSAVNVQSTSGQNKNQKRQVLRQLQQQIYERLTLTDLIKQEPIDDLDFENYPVSTEIFTREESHEYADSNFNFEHDEQEENENQDFDTKFTASSANESSQDYPSPASARDESEEEQEEEKPKRGDRRLLKRRTQKSPGRTAKCRKPEDKNQNQRKIRREKENTNEQTPSIEESRTRRYIKKTKVEGQYLYRSQVPFEAIPEAERKPHAQFRCTFKKPGNNPRGPICGRVSKSMECLCRHLRDHFVRTRDSESEDQPEVDFSKLDKKTQRALRLERARKARMRRVKYHVESTGVEGQFLYKDVVPLEAIPGSSMYRCIFRVNGDENNKDNKSDGVGSGENLISENPGICGHLSKNLMSMVITHARFHIAGVERPKSRKLKGTGPKALKRPRLNVEDLGDGLYRLGDKFTYRVIPGDLHNEDIKKRVQNFECVTCGKNTLHIHSIQKHIREEHIFTPSWDSSKPHLPGEPEHNDQDSTCSTSNENFINQVKKESALDSNSNPGPSAPLVTPPPQSMSIPVVDHFLTKTKTTKEVPQVEVTKLLRKQGTGGGGGTQNQKRKYKYRERFNVERNVKETEVEGQFLFRGQVPFEFDAELSKFKCKFKPSSTPNDGTVPEFCGYLSKSKEAIIPHLRCHYVYPKGPGDEKFDLRYVKGIRPEPNRPTMASLPEETQKAIRRQWKQNARSNRVKNHVTSTGVEGQFLYKGRIPLEAIPGSVKVRCNFVLSQEQGQEAKICGHIGKNMMSIVASHVRIHNEDDKKSKQKETQCQTEKEKASRLARLHPEDLGNGTVLLGDKWKYHVVQGQTDGENPGTTRDVFECDTCGKTSASRQTIVNHIRDIHAFPAHFVCEFCSQEFDVKKVYQRHMIKHSEDRPFVCHLCGASYKTKYYLSLHIRGHGGEFKCTWENCDKVFSARSGLEMHLKSHGNIKNFVCHECGARFARNNYLTRHIESIHLKLVQFVCTFPGCGKEFAHRNIWKRHCLGHEKDPLY